MILSIHVTIHYHKQRQFSHAELLLQIKMQSRIACVKCLVNRELSQGRKNKELFYQFLFCGTRFASRCYIFD